MLKFKVKLVRKPTMFQPPGAQKHVFMAQFNSNILWGGY